jgi:co-chaperonin GroES (HSP10)
MSWTTKTLRPRNHLVLVRLDEQVTHYGSGLIETPEYWREQQVLGTVIAVGPGMVEAGGLRRKSEIEPGMRIVCGKFNGLELEPPDDEPDARGRYWLLETAQLWTPRGRTAESLREADVYAWVEP